MSLGRTASKACMLCIRISYRAGRRSARDAIWLCSWACRPFFRWLYSDEATCSRVPGWCWGKGVRMVRVKVGVIRFRFRVRGWG